MILASNIDILAAAAGPSEFSLDGGPDQWWIAILAATVFGFVLLPFALLFVWVFHKARFDRWIVLTAVLATILSVAATEIMNAYIWGIYSFAEGVLDRIGLGRFTYLPFFDLIASLVGAIGFGWWLKRHRVEDMTGTFE